MAGTVTSDGEQVIAQVTVATGTTDLPLGFTINDPSSLWLSVDVFRVSLGQISERRTIADQPPELITFYTADSTASPAEPAALEVATFRFTGIARVKMSTSSMPAVFQVTRGNPLLSFGITPSGAAMLLNRAPDKSLSTWEEIIPGTASKAGPGTTIIVAPNSAFWLLNVEGESASLIDVGVALAAGIEQQTPLLPDSPWFGVSIDEHLRQPLGQGSAGVQLSLGSVGLPPGASLHVSSDTGLMVIIDSPDELLLSARDACRGDTLATSRVAHSVEALPSGITMLCPDAEYGG
jgi:hypothetical protein